ncbi:hypothetical protein F5Y19DRAFT_483957 [Xylariaceae sp. FL1651]|nr:hypothetical protein F5Y19DRAFT_483957 [Xylariaceae sp. FL1651]
MAQTNGYHAAGESRHDSDPALPTINGTSNRNDGGTQSSPIVIIGMSCKFGGDATSPSKLWDLCAAGKDGWSPIPDTRFSIKSMYHPDSQRLDRHHVKGGFFLKDDITAFDAGFFGLSAESCSALDPQLRFLMESVYEAIENAGIPIENLAGSNTSVFSGIFGKDYYDGLMKDPENLPPSLMTTNGTAMYSNRISHFFDFTGASMTIDTGCSGSLVALHQACRSIQLGESDLAIAGGSGIMLSPDMFIALSNMGVLGEEGRCYSWDHRSGGYGRGEGVATLVLKSLDAALRDGDFVHAVIRESALNQDGKTSTITSPSLEAQQTLIEECYRRAGLDISQTGYVEAHMTGTATGDPIEAEAIARTFGKSRGQDDAVFVGSVKTNVGHAEGVSGLAAIIKTVFALQRKLIPPNLNYEKPNPRIPLAEWKVQVPRRLTPWPANRALRASVNNFGYGGANVHLIIERAPTTTKTYRNGTNGIEQNKSRSLIYIISSKDSAVLPAMGKKLASYIRDATSTRSPEEPLLPTDLAYTLAERRSRFPWVSAVRATSLEDLAKKLDTESIKSTRATQTPPRIGMVFNGQGAQWHAMGRELISEYPVFSSAVQRASRILQNYGAGWSLEEELLRDAETTRVHETDLSQPVTVALQLCLVDLLKSWNIAPSAVTSHSSGEISAAYAVGALSFEEALGVAYLRGKLTLKYQKLSPLAGGMLAVGLSSEKALEYCKDLGTAGSVVVGCVNSPESVTLSGDLAAIDIVGSRLEKDGVFARKLKVPTAYHSHHMQRMAQEYTDSLKAILPAVRTWSGTLFASPVTGDIVTSPKALAPEHWVRNLTSPVLFSQALENMCFSPQRSDGSPSSESSPNANVDMLVEIGPHGTLSGPIRQILKERKLPYVSCLKRSTDAVGTMHDAISELLNRGFPVSLEAVNFPRGPKRHNCLHDLPTYSWNHSSRYWLEPRVSRDHRFPRFSPHELLGTIIPGSNKLTPTWRNHLRISDIPWLADHQLDSNVVLPGAAYVTMAIEAIRLLTDDSEKTIRGYHLRDVNISNALIIPRSSAGVEIQLSLRECSEKELDYKGWYEFELFSVGTQSHWIQHGKGYVMAEKLKGNEAATEDKPEVKATGLDTFLPSNTQAEYIEPSYVYSLLRGMNFYHGMAFQNLRGSRVLASKAITDIAVSPVVAESAKTHVLHPTTLDSIIQACFICVAKARNDDSSMVPRSIGIMFVPRELNRASGDKLKVFTQLLKSDRRGATSSVIVGSDRNVQTEALFHMEDFQLQAIARDDIDDGENPKTHRMCAKCRWEPDVLHNVPARLKDSMRINMEAKEIEFEKGISRAAFWFINDAVNQLGQSSQDSWQWHHKVMHGWMKSIVELGKAGKLSAGSEKWPRVSKGIRQRSIDNLSVENAAGKLTCRVGHKLASIVRGEVTPLELMMEGGLLNQYYQELPRLKDRTFKQLKQLAELYALKQPGAKVLEIGAGTGGATTIVLEAFGAKAEVEGRSGSGSLLGHYDFTDVSAGFFRAAQQKFAAWGDMMDYKKLDIELDPAEQGLAAGSYDLIVAALVLHATKNLRRTMANVRKLLKPGGRLILVENTQDTLDLQLIFGTLPGWWLSEESERKMSPNAPLNIWEEVLKDTGFTGIDFNISDCEEAGYQSTSLIVATAQFQARYATSVSIINSQESLPSRTWLDYLSKEIHVKTGVFPDVEILDSARVTDDKVYIFTPEMAKPFLDKMDRSSFEKLKSLLLNSQGILWLTSSSSIDAKSPLLAQAQGLLRTLKQEDANKRFIQLDFESTSDAWTLDTIPHIVHVFQQSFDYNVDPKDIEWEYAVKDSSLHVPRFYPDVVQDRASSGTQIDPTPVLEPFWQPGRPLAWETSKSGLLSDLYFTDHPDIAGDVPSGMIEIKPKAFGLNFRDVLVGLGQLDETLMSHDGAGVITSVGPNTQGFKVGDKVCGIFRGFYASTERALYTSVAKIPETMSWEEAASIPFVYGTAYIALFDLARLQKGESILIHAATGGLGQALIMLAKHIGAKIFVTCGTEAKRQLLIDRYHIDPSHIFNSRDASFAPGIMAKTNGQGVDVVLNSLAGPLLKATWDCISQFGRFIETGKVDIEAARRLDMTPFSRSATFSGIDLLQYSQFRPGVVQNALATTIRLFNEGSIQPVYPITPYSISDMEKVMRQMQAGLHMGKLVLVPGPHDQVKVLTRRDALGLDHPDSTYLLSGGLGGLGRTIAQWMIEKGARNILIISRNAATHPEAASLCEFGKERGSNVYARNCDVSDEESLVRLLSDCASTMPPIRGVIQGAMQLDDGVLENMTYEQWRHSVLPKVAGTMNLHKHFPKVNFFVMLSSLVGTLGNVSQSNYAAGNAFQDALARHRTANGLPAVTIDLGAVTEVGWVAAAEDTAGVLDRIEKRLGATPITIEQTLRLIEAAIQDPLRKHQDDSQVVTCMARYDAISESAAIKKDRRFGTMRLGNGEEVSATRVASAQLSRLDELVHLLSNTHGTATADDVKDLVSESLVHKIADLFNIPADDIDVALPLSHHGVDSLVAVELRNWLSSAMKVKVTIYDILQSASVTDFALMLVNKSGLLKLSG